MPPFRRRSHAALAATLLGSVALAGTADARVINVAPNHNITVFAGIDFIAAFGDQPGVSTTVEVLRNGQLIGTATGPAVDLAGFDPPNHGGLEVNHGPAGAPEPGDCWTGFTPDIIPGDIVRVTRGAAVEEVEVDNITIDDGPFVDSAGNVVVRGTAALADGTPIPIERLDSGEVRNTSTFRGAPTSVFRTPGTAAGWTMIYDVNRPLDRERTVLTPSARRDVIMAGAHAMGYGHALVPPPAEIQLADGEVPGPALGCEASAGESNAVSSADDKAVNLASADLALTGKAMAATVNDDITQVIPKVSDGTTTLTGAPIDITGAVRTWTATFTRAQLDTLADGQLTVSADYVTPGGAIGGHTLTLAKDVVAPDVTADTAPGEYTGPLSVALRAGAGETITYRTDGLANGANDRAYTGAINLPFGTTTISARVTDAAGNVTDKAFTYTVNAPAAPAPNAVTPPLLAPAPAPLVTGPKLKLDALMVTSRLSLGTARRRGLHAVVFAPDGANYVRVRLLRGRKVIASVVRRVSSDGVMTIVLPQSKKARRALRRGTYRLEVTPGANERHYGATSKRTVRIR